MKTLKDIVEGYKNAMRAQAAYNRNLMKNIGKPVSSEYLDRRKALGDRVTKEKQKMLYRATKASMERDRNFNPRLKTTSAKNGDIRFITVTKTKRDLRGVNIARGIENVVKLGHEGEMKSLVKAEPSKAHIFLKNPEMSRKMKSGSPSFFGPGPRNITDRLQDLHTAWMTNYERKDRPGPYFQTSAARAKRSVPTIMANIMRGTLSSNRTMPLSSMPGNISAQNISDMIRRIDRSKVAGAAAKIGTKPGPEMTSIPLRHLMQEEDVRGQMSFDFEGARAKRVEAERAAAAEDRAFDNQTAYGRGKPKGDIKGIRRLMRKFGKKKS
jgi:hypothetical protein